MFASKNSILKALGLLELDEDSIVNLGGGLIAYVILSFVSIAINVAGVIIQKKAA